LTCALPAVVSYFGPDPNTAWAIITAHEEELQKTLLTYLKSREDAIVYGEQNHSSAVRVPVVTFNLKGKTARSVVEEIQKSGTVAIRWGHFYAKTLIDDVLKLGDDGAIRVSMVHYNTGI
jgi:selenocysteine lyase/cysteine desulfurase